MAIGLLQGFGYYTLIRSYGLIDTAGLPGWWVGIVIVLCFTAGSAFVMWLGEQITEFGIATVFPSSCLPASSPARPA